MKNLLLYLFSFSLLLAVSTSCKDNDEAGRTKGTLKSATFDHTSGTFTLIYSSGQTEKVNADIDNTTKPSSASTTLADGTNIYVLNASISGKAEISKGINLVSEFVYDGMSNFYLWANEIKNKKVTETDFNPVKYFYSILNFTDSQHGWSWITDDVSSLMSGFEGESAAAFGFSPLSLWYDATRARLVGFVRYVYPNTPASKANLLRGEVIDKINGQTITLDNYGLLYGANTPTTFTVLDQNFENPREVTITPEDISTDPVLYSDVYEINDHKIGYLFYTNFISRYNESLHRVFSDFKTAGITDLVLDLRYNPGGGIDAAIYLASLIAPESVVRNKEVFTIMNYNGYVNAAFDDEGIDRKDYLGYYDDKEYPNPLSANLDLGKVHIITTSSSASASELLTFCLKPYMTVEQIGEKTSGKYTASWTIHAYNNYNGRVQPVYRESGLSAKEKSTLKDWAMQPIVGQYTDKNDKDFIATNGLIPNHVVAETDLNERNTATWKPIGDVDDYLFAKAISLITGSSYSPSVRSMEVTPFRNAGLYTPVEEIFRRGVIINTPKITPVK